MSHEFESGVVANEQAWHGLAVVHIEADGGRHSPRDLFRTFCTMAACAVSVGQREEEYLKEISHLERPELDALIEAFALLVMEMEARPYQDLLGPVWMELNGGGMNAQWNGEFYTPQDLSRAIARMMLGEDLPEHRPITIAEPSCGSGNMVLAVVEELFNRKIPANHVWVEARDISKTACDVAYVNLSLYGVPGEVVHGDTLRMTEISRWPTRFRPYSPEREGTTEATKIMAALAPLVETAIEKGEKNDDQSKENLATPVRRPGKNSGWPDGQGVERETSSATASRQISDGEDGRGGDPRTVPRRSAGENLRLF